MEFITKLPKPGRFIVTTIVHDKLKKYAHFGFLVHSLPASMLSLSEKTVHTDKSIT